MKTTILTYFLLVSISLAQGISPDAFSRYLRAAKSTSTADTGWSLTDSVLYYDFATPAQLLMDSSTNNNFMFVSPMKIKPTTPLDSINRWVGANSVEDNFNNSYAKHFSPVITNAGGVTVSAWVNFTNLFTDTVNHTVMSITPANIIFYLLLNGTNIYWNLGGTSVVTPRLMSTGTWHLVVGTATGSVGTIYVDGTQRLQGAVGTINASYYTDYYYGYATMVSYSEYTNIGYSLPGFQGETRVYNRCLTSNEQYSLYTAGRTNALTTVTNGIQLWYQMTNMANYYADKSLIGTNVGYYAVERYTWPYPYWKTNYLSFDGYYGSPSHIDCGQVPQLTGQHKISLGAWVRTIHVNAYGFYNEPIISGQIVGDGNFQSLTLAIASDDETTIWFSFAAGDGSNTIVRTAAGALTSNVWHFVEATLDIDNVVNTNKMRIYIDGLEKAHTYNSAIYSFPPTSGLQRAWNAAGNTSLKHLSIGRQLGGGTGFNWSGDIAHPFILTNAETADQILSRYNVYKNIYQ